MPKLRAAVRAARLGRPAEIGETAVLRVSRRASPRRSCRPTRAPTSRSCAARARGSGRRRPPLPRPRRRPRGRRPRPLPSRAARRRSRAARPALARVEPLLDRAAGRARATALARFGGAQAFFCNSGAEANEAALKYARKATGKAGVVALESSFHGRTIGALAVTGQPAKRRRSSRCRAGVAFARPNDVDSLAAATARDRLHPARAGAQGEGGVHPLEPAFVAAAAASWPTELGALLVFDEVQTGVGRTGRSSRWSSRRAARRRHAGEGARQRAADRLPARGRRAAGRVRAGRPRLDVRRQPGRVRGGVRRLRRDRRRAARARAGARGGAAPQGSACSGVLEVRGRGCCIGAELDRPAARS